ncbi:MAG: HD domain-containing phosphohydrolase, partial [Candidatus Izemoplasma sp.]
MVSKLDDKPLLLNLAAATLIFFLIILGGIYSSLEYNSSLVWPASGFIVIVYFHHKNKVVPAILIGAFLSNFIIRYLVFDFGMVDSLFLASFFAVITIIQAYVFYLIFTSFDQEHLFKYKNLAVFVFGAFIAAITSSILSNILLLFVNSDITSMIPNIQYWFLGDFFGIIIFGSIVYLSHRFDALPDKKLTFYGVGIYIVFVGFTYLILTDALYIIEYQKHSYLFAIFFIFIAPRFSFRTIYVFSITYLIMFYQFTTCLTCDDITFSLLFDIDVFLFTMVFISLTLKLLFINIRSMTSSYEQQNSHLNRLITSTSELLSLSDAMLATNQHATDKYIIKMFRIGISIFDKVDTGSCYVVTDKIRFLDSEGFSLKILNEADLDGSEFLWDFEHPFLQKDAEGALKIALGDLYQDYLDKGNPLLKESVYMSIFLDNEKVGGISFDIKQGSDKTFTKADMAQFDSFQTLMNSFYQLNFLHNKNDNLKNDIVLALIRALDLFDKYTKGHSEDVALISRALGKRLTLSVDEIYDLYWAGIIHDIGKVGVSSDIINKPTKLNEEEFTAIRMHSIYGFEILDKIDDLKHIAKIVKHHHERYDGGGYPDGISGEDIPYLSRIIC